MIDTIPNSRVPASGAPETQAQASAQAVAQGLGTLLQAHAERARIALSVKDASSGRYVWVNAAMASLLAREPADIVGRTDAEWFPAAQQASLRSADQSAASQSAGVVSEHRVDFPAGRSDFSVTRVAFMAATTTLLATLWTDLGPSRAQQTRLRTALEQLELQQTAHAELRRSVEDGQLRDAGTGLYTNAYFDDVLRREVDLSSREHREFSLVLVSLDAGADAAGSAPAGRMLDAPRAAPPERVLDALGRHLRSNTRAMDASCRIGDDRFAVLLSGVGLATAHARMEGLRRECARQIVAVGGEGYNFTIAMGVASFPHTSDTQDGLVAAADLALAEALRRGGNQVSLASIRFEAEPGGA